MSRLLLTPASPLFARCLEAVRSRRMLFLAGLPGTGKSLLLQQLALLAQEQGRTVHRLQWDVTRAAFETEPLLARYPEIDGVTHPVIRKAVGLWARQGIVAWDRQFPAAGHLLLGELPLIGNRLIELAHSLADAAELLLRGEQALFMVPVPTRAVRAHITAARARTIAAPQHEKERKDAQPNVLQMLWQDVARVGTLLGLRAQAAAPDPPYDPQLYTAVFQHLLQRRPTRLLPITEIWQPAGSAYDLQIRGVELAAEPAAAAELIAQVEARYTPESLQQAVENWYRL